MDIEGLTPPAPQPALVPGTPPAEPAAEPPPAPAAEPDAPKDPLAQHIVNEKDLGKQLNDLCAEVKDNVVIALSDREHRIIDETVSLGYATWPFTLGQIEIEMESIVYKMQSMVDEILASLEPNTTQIGRAREYNLHMVSLYLSKYGIHVPSYPPGDGQIQASRASREEQRAQFESEQGLEHRLRFCRNLDAQIIDLLVAHLERFHASHRRALLFESLQNF